jgi:hypothetical protein
MPSIALYMHIGEIMNRFGSVRFASVIGENKRLDMMPFLVASLSAV